MPSHRQRCRCASRSAGRSQPHRSGTARSHHGDHFGSPVRYASHAPIGRVASAAPARSHRGHADACRARYASTGAANPASRPASRHGSLAGVAMPSHRRRCRPRIAPCRSVARASIRHGSLASRRPRRIARSLRLARADRPGGMSRTGSLASRPRSRVSRSLRLAGAAGPSVPPSLPARLAGGRGDAAASPTLPLRIAPCR